jgi:4-diphosphocytidyl-2-C-methyl-D-erythritol kinase
MTTTLHIKSYAKINLLLDVYGKRDDGFHDLRMIMQSISLHDDLYFSINASDTLTLTCDKPDFPTNERNIMAKIYQALKKYYPAIKGLSVDVKKHIPIAAGLAGGSSNGAAMIKALAELFKLHLSPKTIQDICCQFGSDLSFAYHGGSAFAQGRGEQLQTIKLPTFSALLVNPGFGVSTADVFKGLRADDYATKDNYLINLLVKKADISVNDIIKSTYNDLEPSSFRLNSQIKTVNDALLKAGAIFSMMSGSGASCFGLFADDQALQQAYEQLQLVYPHCYIVNPVDSGIEIIR